MLFKFHINVMVRILSNFIGVTRNWVPHEKLPKCSLRTLLTRFLDITTPPTPNMLQFFASCATDPVDKKNLTTLATVSGSIVSFDDNSHITNVVSQI